MGYFWTCPYCESNLDNGEKCNCRNQTKEERQQEKSQALLIRPKSQFMLAEMRR